MAIGHQLVPAVRPAQRGMLVTGVGDDSLSRLEINYRKPDGHEELCSVSFEELVVHVVKDLGRTSTHQGPVLYKGLGNDHEQCSRHSLSGYIGDHKCKMVLVNKEEVVEVSSDLPCRNHRGIDIELASLRIRREYAGKHVGLYLGGNVELGTNSLLLRSDFGDLFDVVLVPFGQILEGLCKNLDLIVRLVNLVHLEYEITVAQLCDVLCQMHQRIGDPLSEKQ